MNSKRTCLPTGQFRIHPCIRVLSAILVLTLFLSTSLSAAAVPDSGQQGRTVYLTYMIGSNLTRYAGEYIDNLYETIDGTGTPNRFVFRAGGGYRWPAEQIALRGERNNDFEIMTGTDGSAGVELYDVTVGSMGLASTLTDFLVRYIQMYDDGNTRFHLVLWDHGGGPNFGFGSDVLYGRDGLSMPELERALTDAKAATGVRLGVVQFFACLMASEEVASMLAPFANYMVASEDSMYMLSEYTPPDAALDPDATDLEVGAGLLDAYRGHLEDTDWEETLSMSLLDLSKIPALDDALDAFGGVLKRDLADSARLTRQLSARSRTHTFGDVPGTDGSTDLADVKSLAEAMNALHPEESTAVLDALDDAVVRADMSEEHEQAGGLMLYHPDRGSRYMLTQAASYATSGAAEGWLDFVQTLVGSVYLDTGLRWKLEDPDMRREADGRLSLTLPEDQWEGVRRVVWWAGDLNSAGQVRVVNEFPSTARDASGTVRTGGVEPFAFKIGDRLVQAWLEQETEEQWNYALRLNYGTNGFVSMTPSGTMLASSVARLAANGVPIDDVLLQAGDSLDGYYRWMHVLDGRLARNESYWYDTLAETATVRVVPFDAAVTGFTLVTWSGDKLHCWLQDGEFKSVSVAGEDDLWLNVQPWARPAVMRAIERGLLADVWVSDFGRSVTRLEVATLLVNQYEYATGREIVTEGVSPFADTMEPAAVKAEELGIIQGSVRDGKRLFQPEQLVSRQDLATMIVRYMTATYAEFSLPAGLSPTGQDARQVAAYAAQAVAWLQREGYMRGVQRMGADGVSRIWIEPLNGASVEQALTILDRIQTDWEGRAVKPQVIPVLENPPMVMANANYLNGLVTIFNFGDVPVDMSGWTAKADKYANEFTFPSGSVLASHGTFYLLTGPSAESRTVGPDTFLWTRSVLFSKPLDSTRGALRNADGLQVTVVTPPIILQAK